MQFKQLDPPKLDQIMATQAEWPGIVATHGDAAINATIGVLLDPATKKPFQPSTISGALQTTIAEIESSNDRGYQSQRGNAAYLKAHSEWVLGTYNQDWPQAQSLGGTGGLRLAANLIADVSESNSLLLDGGWGNHNKVFSGFDITTYNTRNRRSSRL